MEYYNFHLVVTQTFALDGLWKLFQLILAIYFCLIFPQTHQFLLNIMQLTFAKLNLSLVLFEKNTNIR